LIEHIAFEIFTLFVPKRHLLYLAKSFEKQGHLIVVEGHVVFYHRFLLIGSLVPSVEFLFDDLVLALVE
jgi:hypothetical protein